MSENIKEFKLLNSEQKQVVENLEDNIALLAPAGTGKTNTLALRVANIIHNNKCKPEEILCLTFTNKAAKEMKDRISKLIDNDLGDRVEVFTFHSFCFNLLKSRGRNLQEISLDFIVYDEEDCKDIIKEILPKEFKYGEKEIYAFINLIKGLKDFNESYEDTLNRVINTSEKDGITELHKISSSGRYFDYELFNFYKEHAIKLLRKYDKKLLEYHGMDFNDLIINTINLFQEEGFYETLNLSYKYIHIDEVQDTNLREYGVLQKLFKSNKIMLCGDTLQTIYRWRGATGGAIFRKFMKEEKAVLIKLRTNYRSTENLLLGAASFVKNVLPNPQGYGYDLIANSENKGENIKITSYETLQKEALGVYEKILSLGDINYSKVAILTRNNYQNQELSNILRKIKETMPKEKQLEFMLVDEFKFFKRSEIKDLLAVFKFLVNSYDNSSLKRMVKKFGKGIGNITIESLEKGEELNIGIRFMDLVQEETFNYGEPFRLLNDSINSGNVVVMDVESTGIDTSNDEIVQIAAIKINLLGAVIESFERFLIPKKELGSSEKVHGFSKEFLLENGVESIRGLEEFVDFSKGCVIVGHNINYDLTIMKSQIAREGARELDITGVFDTLDIARRFYPEFENHKLENLSKKFKVENPSTHNAMDDILATKDILMEMVRQKIIPTSYDRANFYSPYLNKFKDIKDNINNLKELSEKISPEELLEEVINMFNVYELYDKIKIENIKELYEIVKNFSRELKGNINDKLTEILKITALSNSELDTLIEKFPKIPILTIHGAKGLEFDYVFMPYLTEGIFPSFRAIKEDKLLEEKSIFYVGLTRAKKELFLSYHKLNGSKVRNRSQFIDNIDVTFVEHIN